jgi:hypothetical protein
VVNNCSKGGARRPPTKEQLTQIAKILGHKTTNVSFYTRSTKKKCPNEARDDENEPADDNADADTDADADADSERRVSKPKTKTKAPKQSNTAKGRTWQISKLSPSSAELNKLGKFEYGKYIVAKNAYPDDSTHVTQVERCFLVAAKERPGAYEKCEFLWTSMSVF